MRKSLLFLSLFIISIYAQDVVKINYPSKNMKINSVNKNIYLTGVAKINDIKELYINDKLVKLDKDGGFVIYDMPKIMGPSDTKNYYNAQFDIVAITKDGKRVEKTHTLLIKYPKIQWQQDKIEIIDVIEPFGDVIIKKGEEFAIKFRATPNTNFWIEVEGVDKKFQVSKIDYIDKHYWADITFGEGYGTNIDTVDGLYFATVKIDQELSNAKINICYKENNINKSYTIKPKVSLLDKNVFSVVKTLKDKFDNPIIFRNSPGGGYKLFLLPDTKLNVIGKNGTWLKCQLASGVTGYVSEANCEIVKDLIQQAPIRLNYVRVEEDENFIYLKTDSRDVLPYEVQVDEKNLIKINLYNCFDDIDFIRDLTYPSQLSFVTHNQEIDGVVTISLKLTQKALWGYQVEFVDNVMIFKFRKQPIVEGKKIKHLVVSIDPGHSPDPGAVGVYGLAEKEINFILSNKLKKMLEEKNIKVYITRTQVDKGPDLRERKKIVNSFEPHISVSIHNNAVPENVNPILNNGASVYYYFNHSRKFAENIHNNFMKNLKLKNFGLFWDNLYMCRIPESVSVLVEPAFIMLPEQERMLKNEEFQNQIVKSIYDAIISYTLEYAQ